MAARGNWERLRQALRSACNSTLRRQLTSATDLANTAVEKVFIQLKSLGIRKVQAPSGNVTPPAAATYQRAIERQKAYWASLPGSTVALQVVWAPLPARAALQIHESGCVLEARSIGSKRQHDSGSNKPGGGGGADIWHQMKRQDHAC